MSERQRFEAWARTQPRHEGASMRFLPLNNAYIDFDLHGAWLAWQAARSGQAASGSSQGARSDERTGWPPGLLQDDSRELSRALASKPDAMVHARDAVAKIGQPEAPTAAPPGSWDEYAMHEADRLWSLPAMPKAQLVASLHCALIDAMKFAAAWTIEVARVPPLVPRARSGAGSEEKPCT